MVKCRKICKDGNPSKKVQSFKTIEDAAKKMVSLSLSHSESGAKRNIEQAISGKDSGGRCNRLSAYGFVWS